MERLINQLKRHEGVKPYAYLCSEGYTTIGVGRNIDSKGGIGLSTEEIELLLYNDIRRCRNELRANFVWFSSLSFPRQEALINICFNLGITRLLGFKKALAAMEQGDFKTAANEFLDSKWAKQVGNRAIELAEQIKIGGYVIV